MFRNIYLQRQKECERLREDMVAIFKCMKLSSDRKGISYLPYWNRANGSVLKLQQLDIKKKLILLPRKAKRLLLVFITS